MALLGFAVTGANAKRALAILVGLADRVVVAVSIAAHHTIVVAILLGAGEGKDGKDCDDDGARVHGCVGCRLI